MLLRALLRPLLRAPLALAALAFDLVVLAGCPTRLPPVTHDDAAGYDAQVIDPRVPNVGRGMGGPSCSPEEVIDFNALAFRSGPRELRIRVDTQGRRNDLHLDCVDRDSSEAVFRYAVPPIAPDGTRVWAIRVSTVAPATVYDTVLAVRNDCGPDYRDYSCNNDGFLDDGRETRRSTVYFTSLEPEQYVYILVDGFEGSAGVAEVVLEEITDPGTLYKPCLPVPREFERDPLAPLAASRCPHPGLQCRPGAASDGTDLCLPLLALGSPCDPDERRNVCEPSYVQGVTCAQNPMDRTQALCALPGTAAGATCRRSEPRCDGRLVCSPGAGFGGTDICVPLRGNGATCDPTPRGFTNRCEDGLRCCGDAPADAGPSYFCRPQDYSPCYDFVPAMP